MIGLLGQGLIDFYSKVCGSTIKDAGSYMIVTLIFLSSLFTAMGFFDDIVSKVKCGIIVPITGFANSIVAPAIEYKSEGYVMGVGGKMFTVAGPVLVFGISTSVIIGIIASIF